MVAPRLNTWIINSQHVTVFLRRFDGLAQYSARLRPSGPKSRVAVGSNPQGVQNSQSYRMPSHLAPAVHPIEHQAAYFVWIVGFAADATVELLQSTLLDA